MIVRRAAELADSGYVRAVATLSTGQFVAALIPLFAAPILGRLYLPSDYGALATYMAIASVLGAVSTLQFQQGIIVESSEQRAVALIDVCLWVSGLVSLVALVISVALFLGMGGSSSFADVRGWLLLLPVTALGAGATAAIAALANRRKRYGFMARIQIIAVAATVLVSIVLGWLQWGAHGLFTSYVLGNLITVGAHVRLYHSMIAHRPRLDRGRLLAVARRHWRFPAFSLPTEVTGTISMQLPVFALSAVGALPLLGAFTRARQLVSMPITLVGGSIGQVFRQRAAEQYRDNGNCRRIYVRTFLVLLAAGLPPTLLLMAIAPQLFRVVLGPNWTEAGEIARILAPMLLLRMTTSPLTNVFIIAGAQREALILMVGGTILCAAAVLYPIVAGVSEVGVVYGFAGAYSVIYLAHLIRGWRHCNGPQAAGGRALQ